jgi:putative membrane protein
MITFLVHLVVSAGMLLLVSRIVAGVEVDDFGSAMLAALMLGLANAFVRPLLVLFTLPLTVLTFGLFLFVVNGLVLQLVGALVPGFRVESLGSAVLGSLLLTILNMAIAGSLSPMS